jgi:ketosteroid isomerase-like protein
MHPTEVADQLYDAFARRDFVEFLSLLTPDVRWIERDGLPYEGVRHGRRAIMAEVFEPLTMDWRRFELRPVHVTAHGERVLVSGRYCGELMLSGRELGGSFVHLLLMREERLAEAQLYGYALAAMNALDGIPGPALG